MLGSEFIKVNIPDINRVVKFFIIGDLFLWSGWGVVDPLFSVFVVQNIEGANVLTIGYLAGIFWITRSLTQIPVSLYLDKIEGEKDDFYALVLGLFIISVGAFSFILAKSVTQLYIIQFFKAIGFALYIPAWAAIFTRHIDRTHSAFEWAISSSSVGLGIGAAGLIGGLVASVAGFSNLFFLTGFMSLASALILLFAPDLILPRRTIADPQIPGDHIRTGLK